MSLGFGDGPLSSGGASAPLIGVRVKCRSMSNDTGSKEYVLHPSLPYRDSERVQDVFRTHGRAFWDAGSISSRESSKDTRQ